MNTNTFAAAYQPSPPPPPSWVQKITWPAVAVAVTLSLQAIGLVSWLAVLEHRVTIQEQAVPPGAIAKLEERVDSVKETVEKIDRRLEARVG